MSGHILLAGGAEFGGALADLDRRALALAGGADAPLVILPTAAAPDNNQDRAGRTGAAWFRSLGARNVTVLPLLRRKDAADPALAATLEAARFIYLLGGFTHYLGQTLLDSAAWAAMRAAHAQGAVIGGSSAGAMVLCDPYYDPARDAVERGLGLVANVCVLPHHNSFGRRWAAGLGRRLPDAILLGLDERTGILNDGPGGTWQIYGAGSVTLYNKANRAGHQPASPFALPPR